MASTYDRHELTALDALLALAGQRRITVNELLSDLLAADARFRKIQGRAVVSSEAGTAALCDAVNELLHRHGPDSEPVIRRELMRLGGVTGIADTLTDAVTAVSKRKQARHVLTRIATITTALHQRT